MNSEKVSVVNFWEREAHTLRRVRRFLRSVALATLQA